MAPDYAVSKQLKFLNSGAEKLKADFLGIVPVKN